MPPGCRGAAAAEDLARWHPGADATRQIDTRDSRGKSPTRWRRTHLAAARSAFRQDLIGASSRYVLTANTHSACARRRLVRPRHGRMLAGVAAGLARRYGVSPALVRILFLVSMILPGPQILAYLASVATRAA